MIIKYSDFYGYTLQNVANNIVKEVDKIMSTKKPKKNVHAKCEEARLLYAKSLYEDLEKSKKYGHELLTSYKKAAKQGSEKIEDLQHTISVQSGRISALEMSLVLMENHAKTQRAEIMFLKRNPESLALAVGDEKAYTPYSYDANNKEVKFR